MKLVAAAKMRKAQERMEQARPYADHLAEVITSLLPDVDRSLLSLLDVREVKREALVVVTSDRGLAGAFNANIIRRAEEEISETGQENVDLICIGRKGRDHFRVRGYEIIRDFTDFWSDLSFKHAVDFGLADRAVPKAQLFEAVRVEIKAIKLGGPNAVVEC